MEDGRPVDGRGMRGGPRPDGGAARGVERAEESLHPSLRHSRYWALAAFLLLVTAFWLPWWVVAYEDDVGFVYDREAAHLFNPEPPATNGWAPHLTGALAAAVAAWLFIRVAGRSHAYEPAQWSRDLALQAGGLVLALASTILWPDGVPRFWGGHTYAEEGVEFTESAMPGLGWWLALLAAVLLGVAWWVARPARAGPDGRTDRSTDSP